jgi:molecular chaperone GrpE
MPDAAPPLQLECLNGQSAHGALTPERIERALADFRDWLTDPPPGESLLAPIHEPVDLHALVGQFIALRHEVNLQTKASRASLEQNAETIKRLDDVVDELRNLPEQTATADTKPLLKALVDVYDALALSLKQVERQKAAIVTGLETVTQTAASDPPPPVAIEAPTRPGFWQRLFGATAATSGSDLERWRERILLQSREREVRVRTTVDFLKQSLNGLITGYTMSLNRIDRVLPQFGLERIECVGESFDPEMMEVVEVVTAGEGNEGEVVEEVRRGYHLNGAIFRYAQVRVAK